MPVYRGELIYYTGSWTGNRPADGLQYFGQAGRVKSTHANHEVVIVFADGLSRKTKHWSWDEPMLPGEFKMNQQVYYAGSHADSSGFAYFGEKVQLCGRVKTDVGHNLLVQPRSGSAFKTCNSKLSLARPRHSSGYQLGQTVFYTGTAANKWFHVPTSYFGQAAVIESFIKDSNRVRLKFSDDKLLQTSSITLLQPKLWATNFSIGDELYYVGQLAEKFGKRATIRATLPGSTHGIRIEFRDGATRSTTIEKVQQTRPQRPSGSGSSSFHPPSRPTFQDLIGQIERDVARMQLGPSLSRGQDQGVRFSSSVEKWVSLDEIFYSQDSIKQAFQDGRSLLQMERELRGGVKDLRDIPYITVVQHQGRLLSVDNRRLWVFKQVFSGTKRVPVLVGMKDHRFWNKFTTNNNGTRIRLR